MPYALSVAAVAILAGTLPTGFGMPWWLAMLIGPAALWIILRTLGRRASGVAARFTRNLAFDRRRGFSTGGNRDR